MEMEKLYFVLELESFFHKFWKVNSFNTSSAWVDKAVSRGLLGGDICVILNYVVEYRSLIG